MISISHSGDKLKKPKPNLPKSTQVFTNYTEVVTDAALLKMAPEWLHQTENTNTAFGICDVGSQNFWRSDQLTMQKPLTWDDA